MTYNPNIPQGSDDISVSQVDLLGNFGSLNTVFSVDHVAYDAVADSGKHNKVTFVRQASAPAIPVGSTKVAVYGALPAGGTQTELFGVDQLNTPWQMTKNQSMYLGAHPAAAVNFDSAGAIQSQYNVTSVTKSSTGLFTVNFTSAVVGPSGAATNNYFWSISGFSTVANGVITGGVQQAANYNTVVDPNGLFLKVQFKQGSGNTLVDPVRAVVIVWRLQ